MDWTLERGEAVTGVPADVIREVAHAYAKADRAMICWTLGITEHHNAVDNVLSLINLSLLTGHVGRYGSGVNPLRGQNNVQGGGDMGAIPNKLPGFQDIEQNAEARARFEAAWDVSIIPTYGYTLTQMFEAMDRGELTAAYVIGENPASSEADKQHTEELLVGLDSPHRAGHLHDADGRARRRRVPGVQRVLRIRWHRDQLRASGTAGAQGARPARQRAGRHLDHRRTRPADGGAGGARSPPTTPGRSSGRLSPMHAGMSWQRLEDLGGLQWPCPDEQHPGTLFLHARLWADDPQERGPKAPFSIVIDEPPVDELDEEFPLRLTTGRRLDSYNTGVQTGAYTSPLRRGETIDVSPEDAERLGLAEEQCVVVSSRRGSLEVPVHVDPALRPGLVFMTFHFPDQVDTNVLTIEATDPKSGTAEFKASAVRIDTLPADRPVAVRGGGGQ